MEQIVCFILKEKEKTGVCFTRPFGVIHKFIYSCAPSHFPVLKRVWEMSLRVLFSSLLFHPLRAGGSNKSENIFSGSSRQMKLAGSKIWVGVGWRGNGVAIGIT